MQAKKPHVSWVIMAILVGGTETALWAQCQGGTCYVDDDCLSSPDGTSGDPDCTIQAGINRAVNGDTVLVRAGTYASEDSIDFNGKAITVKRETDTILPVITTTGTGAVIKVKFQSGETATSILDGFEISGGSA